LQKSASFVITEKNLVQYILVRITLLHLNIEEGKRQDTIIEYVKQHNFDVLMFQEVTAGEANYRGTENFPSLKAALGYDGIQSVYWRLKDDPGSYMSNATFFKPLLPPVTSKTIFLKPYRALTREEMSDYSIYSMSALDTVFTINDKNIHFINTHLVWGPTPEDKPYKLEQGKRLYEYVKSLTEPFVLSGDFNVTADSQIVKWMDELGVNHSVEHGLTNTLNPNTHRVKHLFPKGLAVDFLYTEKSIEVTDFKLVDAPDLSDHYGLQVTLDV
jgi:endonuclease/exonuclease/phosphatase family metal-dependent hydrolase